MSLFAGVLSIGACRGNRLPSRNFIIVECLQIEIDLHVIPVCSHRMPRYMYKGCAMAQKEGRGISSREKKQAPTSGRETPWLNPKDRRHFYHGGYPCAISIILLKRTIHTLVSISFT